MNKVQVVWLSRHEMTEEQKADLARTLGRKVEDIKITSENLLWQATTDVTDDVRENSEKWAELEADYEVVTGVFPPVALEAASYFTFHRPDFRVFTPISQQTREERADGTAQIAFRHVRWAKLG